MDGIPADDRQQWLDFRQGDREAFAAIYRQHIRPLITYGFRLCPDRDLLKDQIQELFVELWGSRQNIDTPRSPRFYLIKALRYKLIRLEKNQYLSRQSARLADLGNVFQEPVENAIIEVESHASRAASLRQAIRTLSLRQQEAIQLRYFQGFSHDQIADLMELNYQSVSNLLHRALNRLKEVLKSPATHLVFLAILKILLIG